jgi:hypothetical protein
MALQTRNRPQMEIFDKAGPEIEFAGWSWDTHKLDAKSTTSRGCAAGITFCCLPLMITLGWGTVGSFVIPLVIPGSTTGVKIASHNSQFFLASFAPKSSLTFPKSEKS